MATGGSGRRAHTQQAPSLQPLSKAGTAEWSRAGAQGFRTPERRGTSVPWDWPLGRWSISASLTAQAPCGESSSLTQRPLSLPDPESQRKRTVQNVLDLRQNLEETMSSLRGSQVTHR